MTRNPTSPAALRTDPQHCGLFLFKGKTYLWLAYPPMARDKPTDPQPRVRIRINGAYGVGRAWWHPDKIPSSSRKPKSDLIPPVTTYVLPET